MQQMHYLIVGLPFSGKTTLSKKLSERFGFARLNIDEVKFERGYEGVSDDDVPDKIWDEIHKEMDERLVSFLQKGQTVLNENAWMLYEWREGKRKIASQLGVPTKVIYLPTSEKKARNRMLKNREINERFDIPDKIFDEAVRDFEIPTINEDVIPYSSDEDFEAWVSDTFSSS